MYKFVGLMLVTGFAWLGVLYVFGPLPGAPEMADNPIYYGSAAVMGVIGSVLIRWGMKYFRGRENENR